MPRSFLDIIQRHLKNEFYQWRSLLATNLEEALSVATAQHTYSLDYYGNDEMVWREMLNMLPSHTLYSIAIDERVKQENRALIARVLFTRAVLLNYDNDLLDKYAVLAAKLNPAVREQLLESVAGHNNDKYISFSSKDASISPGSISGICRRSRKKGRRKRTSYRCY